MTATISDWTLWHSICSVYLKRVGFGHKATYDERIEWRSTHIIWWLLSTYTHARTHRVLCIYGIRLEIYVLYNALYVIDVYYKYTSRMMACVMYLCNTFAHTNTIYICLFAHYCVRVCVCVLTLGPWLCLNFNLKRKTGIRINLLLKIILNVINHKVYCVDIVRMPSISSSPKETRW